MRGVGLYIFHFTGQNITNYNPSISKVLLEEFETNLLWPEKKKKKKQSAEK